MSFNVMDLIRIERRKIGLTQKQFGKALGVGINAVQQWETGERHPSLKNLQALVNLTGNAAFCSTDWTESRKESVQSEVDHILENKGDKIAPLLGLIAVQLAALVDAFEGVE